MNFIKADKLVYQKIKAEFGKEKADLLYFNGGFTYVALDNKEIAGFISAKINKLPYVLNNIFESFIDVIEVKEKYRRQGIAKKLLKLSERESKKIGAYQIRAWSSKDKKEAIMMWKKLGFSLHPQEIISIVTKKPVKGYFITKIL